MVFFHLHRSAVTYRPLCHALFRAARGEFHRFATHHKASTLAAPSLRWSLSDKVE